MYITPAHALAALTPHLHHPLRFGNRGNLRPHRHAPPQHAISYLKPSQAAAPHPSRRPGVPANSGGRIRVEGASTAARSCSASRTARTLPFLTPIIIFTTTIAPWFPACPVLGLSAHMPHTCPACVANTLLPLAPGKAPQKQTHSPKWKRAGLPGTQRLCILACTARPLSPGRSSSYSTSVPSTPTSHRASSARSAAGPSTRTVTSASTSTCTQVHALTAARTAARASASRAR